MNQALKAALDFESRNVAIVGVNRSGIALTLAQLCFLARFILDAHSSSCGLRELSRLPLPLERAPSCGLLELELLSLPLCVDRHGMHLGLRLGFLAHLHDASIDGLARVFISDQRRHSRNVFLLDLEGFAAVCDLAIALTALLFGLFGLALFALFADLGCALLRRSDGSREIGHGKLSSL